MPIITLARQTLRYPPEFDSDFKRAVLERDNYTCAMCQKRKEKLDVHHIDYTKRTVRTNCIALCRNCHNYLHSRQWYYKNHMKNYFYGLVLVREGW